MCFPGVAVPRTGRLPASASRSVWGEGRHDATSADEEDMQPTSSTTTDGRSRTCHRSIWPKLSDVEEGADTGRVDAVLGLGADPLGVEVLLGHVAGEGGTDRDEEGDHAGDPGEPALAPPGRHEELAPQVDDHEEEEDLDAPQVEAVDEEPRRTSVPPVGPTMARTHSGEDDHQGGERQDAEDIDPGRHIGGLTIGQELSGGKGRGRAVAAGLSTGGRVRAEVEASYRGLGRPVLSTLIGLSLPRRGRGSSWRHEDHDHQGDQDQIGHRDGMKITSAGSGRNRSD